MKVLVTGMRGTVAPALARALRAAGHDVVAWDRGRVPVHDEAGVHAYVHHERPAAFCHVATGPAAWAEWCARACAERGVPFLFTGSVSVFGSVQRGPFGVADEPQPDDDYGRYKLECERRVLVAHAGARAVRLGWQIGGAPGGNQMVDFLDRTAREQGVVRASTAWRPACSFLEDTAASLARALFEGPAGLLHLDGNPGLDFHEIASRLRRRLDAPWRIEATSEPARDHRLRDARVPVTPITARLTGCG